jgi:hypothetical protein
MDHYAWQTFYLIETFGGYMGINLISLVVFVPRLVFLLRHNLTYNGPAI